MNFDDMTTLDLVHQILAREATRAFELARGLGFDMPREFDCGMRYIVEGREREGERVRFHLRAADAVVRVVVLLPSFNRRMSLNRVDVLWKRAMADLHRAATSLAHVWIDLHPESRPVDAQAAIARLEAVIHDDTASEAWSSEATRAARAARYEMR